MAAKVNNDCATNQALAAGDADGTGAELNPALGARAGQSTCFALGPACPLFLGSHFWALCDGAILSQSCLMGCKGVLLTSPQYQPRTL